MAIRATITTTAIVAHDSELSYIKPKTVVTHVNAAMVAFINADSINQWFYEIVPLHDVEVKILNKPLYDEVSLIEDVAKIFGSTKTETLSLVENFKHIVHFRRHIDEGFTLDDFATINKDFIGNKTNVAFVDDSSYAAFAKSLTDDFSFSEDFKNVLRYIRDITDEFAFSEMYDVEVRKQIGDLLDTFEDAYATNLRKSLFSDNTSLIDAYGLDSKLVKSDSISNISDTSTLDTSLVKSDDDNFDFTDSTINVFAKALSDGFALDDLATINKDFEAVKGNIFGISEVLALSVKYQRLFNLDTIGFSDGTTVDNTLVKSNDFNFDDSSVISAGKNIESRFTASDFHTTMYELYHDTPLTNIECAQLLHTVTPEGAFLGDLILGSVPPIASNISNSFATMHHFIYDGPTHPFLITNPDMLVRVYALLNAGAEVAIIGDTTSLQSSLTKSDTSYITDTSALGVTLLKEDTIDNVTDAQSKITSKSLYGTPLYNLACTDVSQNSLNINLLLDTISFLEDIDVVKIHGVAAVQRVLNGSTLNTHTIG